MNEKITNITFDCKTIDSHSIYKFKIGFDYTWTNFDNSFKKESKGHRLITIHQQPTGNCQLSTICTFSNITCFNDDDLQKLFKFIYEKAYVKLLLFDINEQYISKFEKIFLKKYICFKNEYISTNKSKMCIFGINLRQFVWDITPEKEVKTDPNTIISRIVQENNIQQNTDIGFEEVVEDKPAVQKKVTRVKPKKRDIFIIHHTSSQQREQLRNISNIHKF